MAGLPILGVNPVDDPQVFQTLVALQNMARQMEWHFWNGTYQADADSTTAGQMKGLVSGITTNSVNAAAAVLTDAMFEEALQKILDNGGGAGNLVAFTNNLVGKLNKIYGHAPSDRTIGGVNIKQIETPFGNTGLMYSPDVPAGQIFILDLSLVAPVFLPVPNKGRVFEEEKYSAGASIGTMLYSQASLTWGTEKRHAKIINAVKA